MICIGFVFLARSSPNLCCVWSGFDLKLYFFDIRNHIGDNGLLISGIEELDLSANDVVVKINKKDIRGLLEGDIRKLINASHGAFNQIEFLKHPHFHRNALDPKVSRVWCYHILQFSKEKKCELPLTN